MSGAAHATHKGTKLRPAPAPIHTAHWLPLSCSSPPPLSPSALSFGFGLGSFGAVMPLPLPVLFYLLLL